VLLPAFSAEIVNQEELSVFKLTPPTVVPAAGLSWTFSPTLPIKYPESAGKKLMTRSLDPLLTVNGSVGSVFSIRLLIGYWFVPEPFARKSEPSPLQKFFAVCGRFGVSLVYAFADAQDARIPTTMGQEKDVPSINV